MKIKLLIVDDHELVRSAIKEFLAVHPDMDLVAEAGCGADLLGVLPAIQADVLLQDMEMPGICGAELIGRVKAEYPNLRILVLSMHYDAMTVHRAMKAGASGYISKACAPQMLIEAIRKVHNSGRYLESAMAEKLVYSSGAATVCNPEQMLSRRERIIMPMLIEGIPIKTIANALSISDKTVSTHKSHLLSKLGLRNVPELVKYSMQNKLEL